MPYAYHVTARLIDLATIRASVRSLAERYASHSPKFKAS